MLLLSALGGRLEAQATIGPSNSLLFHAPVHVESPRAAATAARDEVRDEKVLNAVLFGVIGGLLGTLVAEAFYDDSPAIVVTLALFGAIAGWKTGG